MSDQTPRIGGVMWDGRDRDSIQQVQFQTEEIERLCDRVQRRDNLLQEREDEIGELHGRVARREEEISELLGRVAMREAVIEDLSTEVEELRGQVARRDSELETQWNTATAEATRRATSNRMYISGQDARLLQMQEEITLMRRTIDEQSEGTGSSIANEPVDTHEGASADEAAGGTSSGTVGAVEQRRTYSFGSSDSDEDEHAAHLSQGTPDPRKPAIINQPPPSQPSNGADIERGRGGEMRGVRRH
jgi:predicted RNase H-like nuclease (RuvC/YqgF family)